jgi:hypothetical protein
MSGQGDCLKVKNIHLKAQTGQRHRKAYKNRVEHRTSPVTQMGFSSELLLVNPSFFSLHPDFSDRSSHTLVRWKFPGPDAAIFFVTSRSVVQNQHHFTTLRFYAVKSNSTIC